VNDQGKQGGEPPLIPILVDSMGRDGSTLTMQLLGSAREIAFDRIYPFEQRYLSYLLAIARVIQVDEWDTDTWNLNRLVMPAETIDRSGLVGPVPWQARRLLDGGDHPDTEAWRSIFDLLWGEFSRRARSAARSEHEDPALPVTHYAEKAVACWMLDHEFLDQVRLLALLRDPRDAWISTVAFHQRMEAEGWGGFMNLREGEGVSDYLSTYIAGQRARMRWMSTLGDGALLIRYERLVVDPPAESKRLGGWLDIELKADAIEESGWLDTHVTTRSPAESIGRWRREMSADVAELFAREMTPELEAHGYDV
jgi:hypothetical protein